MQFSVTLGCRLSKDYRATKRVCSKRPSPDEQEAAPANYQDRPPFHPNVPAWSFLYIPCAFLICLVIFIYGSVFVKNLPYFFLSLYFCATVYQTECLFLDSVKGLFRVLFEWCISNKGFLSKPCFSYSWTHSYSTRIKTDRSSLSSARYCAHATTRGLLEHIKQEDVNQHFFFLSRQACGTRDSLTDSLMHKSKSSNPEFHFNISLSNSINDEIKALISWVPACTLFQIPVQETDMHTCNHRGLRAFHLSDLHCCK